MANYYGVARSNYFHVGDPKGFTEWCDELGLTWEYESTKEESPDMRVAIFSNEEDGWPSYLYKEGNDGEIEEREIDLPHELAQFLAPETVAVLMEVGNEKLRYLTGIAVAVHPSGETLQVTLGDIYRDAHEMWGITPTECCY